MSDTAARGARATRVVASRSAAQSGARNELTGDAAGAAASESTAASTLRQVLAGHARCQPHATLLIAPETGATLTYGELDRQARAIDARLRAAGLEPGDKVATFLPNGYQATVVFLGSMTGGYVAAPLNLLAQRTHLAYTLEHSDAKVVVTCAPLEARVREALACVGRPIEVLIVDPDDPGAWTEGRAELARSPGSEAAGREPDELAPIDPDAAALLMYTSGTTGLPKGVLLTHRNLLAAARTVAAWHGLGREDRVASSLPLYHINGQVIATLSPFVSGGSLIAPRRFSVSSFWTDVERFAATWINMVPTIIAFLLHAAEPGRSYSFPRVRFGRSASAPLPPEHHGAFERTFGIPVIEAMGMTESASVVFANPQSPSRRRIGSPGLPCGVEAKVVAPDDASCTPLADGERGELMLRGPNVMAGYYKAPDLTRKALEPDGWLHTGDLGYRDADGFYFVTGRLKELIIKGGENIAPREIDEALLRHPGVLEAAAVGVPDDDYGQEILACVVAKAGVACTEAELRDFCMRELGPYKTPKFFRFVGELPKGPSGKVQRLALVDTVQAKP